MKAAGIVAEYNPYHNGHAYQVARTRCAGATHIAAVMSGNVTQRGEPAVMPKAARCEAALRGGVDLIVELPLPWACAPAKTFATGAVAILNALGCIDLLSFGSECGDVGRISRMAQAVDRLDGNDALAQALAAGMSFPRARQHALKGLLTSEELALLGSPNDVLAMEYLRALGRLHSPIVPLAVPRKSAPHDAEAPADGFASASYLRGLLQSGKTEEAFRFVPPEAAVVYRRALDEGCAPFSPAAFEPLLLAQLRRLGAADFAALPDVGEGLENRVARAVTASTTLEQLLFAIKTKRYPLARIRRVLLAAFLGLDRALTKEPPPYIRILGFNERGGELLRRCGETAGIPLVTRRSQILRLPPRAQRVYGLECLFSDLYGLCLPRRQPCASEQKYSPVRTDR